MILVPRVVSVHFLPASSQQLKAACHLCHSWKLINKTALRNFISCFYLCSCGKRSCHSEVMLVNVRIIEWSVIKDQRWSGLSSVCHSKWKFRDRYPTPATHFDEKWQFAAARPVTPDLLNFAWLFYATKFQGHSSRLLSYLEAMCTALLSPGSIPHLTQGGLIWFATLSLSITVAGFVLDLSLHYKHVTSRFNPYSVHLRSHQGLIIFINIRRLNCNTDFAHQFLSSSSPLAIF